MLPTLRRWLTAGASKPERRAPAPLQLDVLEDRAVPATFVVDSNLTGFGITLADAVNRANTTAGADTITFAAALANGDPAIGAKLTLTESVTIDGTGGHAISATGANGLFRIAGAGDYLFQNITLQNANDLAANGGAIEVAAAANLTVQAVTFNGNQALAGGAISLDNAGATLTVVDSDFLNNTTSLGDGGAIFLNNPAAAATQISANSTFTGNQSVGNGGAIGGSGALTARNASFTGNSGGRGGAINLEGAGFDVALTNVSFANNATTSGNGGAVGIVGTGAIAIADATFTGNTAVGGRGGAFALGDGNGALANPTVAVTVDRTTIRDNNADTGGGGASIEGALTALFRDVEIVGNVVNGAAAANQGGGVRTAAFNTRLERVTVADNDSNGAAGGVFVQGRVVAPGPGPAPFNQIDVFNSTIDLNVTAATNGGHAIDSAARALATISNSTITRNEGGNQALAINGTIQSSIVENGVLFPATGVEFTINPAPPPPVFFRLFTLGNNIIDPSYIFRPPAAPFTNPPPDIVGIAALGERVNNGGFTTTRMPTVGSIAIGAGALGVIPANGMAAVQANTDQRGAGFPRIVGDIDVGAVESPNVVTSTPQILLLTAPNVTDASIEAQTTPIASYQFTVRYTDSQAIRVSSLGIGDTVVVKNDIGYSAIATVVAISSATDAGQIVVTYSVVPPGGSWSADDNGTYRIVAIANAGVNVTGVGTPGGILGFFVVNVTGTAIAGTPPPAPTPEAGAVFAARANAGYVQALYSAILGRAADNTSLVEYQDRLNAGASRIEIAREIWESAEHRALQVTEAYRRFLNRNPLQNEIDDYAKRFKEQRRFSEEVLYQEIAASPEARSRNNSDIGLVGSFYSLMIGRGADLAFQPYVEKLAKDSQLAFDIAGEVLDSVEYGAAVARVFYRSFLLRAAENPALLQQYGAFLGGKPTQRDLALEILTSDEFYQNIAGGLN